MKHVRLLIIAVFSVLFISQHANAQFGKNKVQYQVFDWKYIESEHFDVYFYTGEEYLAKFTAIEAEKALLSIQGTLNFRINDRIKLIVFNTHNEFQQNNIISQFMPEGVGGVTELFKNRVVVPFQGDYAQFRHVIHHELVHAVLNQMFYGGTFQSALAQGNFMIPMWINEGLCEYESRGGYDVETDMFMRDITIHEMLPSLDRMSGYMAYRGGQNFFWYVSEKYGKEKVGDFIKRLKILRNLDAAFRSAFNMTLEDFSDKWERDIKKYYWTDLEKFENPKDYAKQITEHEKERTFYNTSPAISPNGERMAYISAPEGIFGVYVTDLANPEEYRKIVSSFRQQDFEDLNVLTPGISWNPEGTKLAISAKSGGEDAIFIVDVDQEDYIKKTFGLKSITSCEWSPDGDMIVFVGVEDESSDLYIYDIPGDSIRPVTSDVFSDQFPAWSPDSKTVYFVSDRGGNLSMGLIGEEFDMWDYNVGKSDIYSLELESGQITRLTDNPDYTKTSVKAGPNNENILYASSKNGIGNIYLQNLNTGDVRPLTNSITGITQISISPDGSKLLFATQIKGAYDIFMLRYPLQRNLEVGDLPLTTYRQLLLDKKLAIEELANGEAKEEAESEAMEVSEYGDFSIDFERQKVVNPNDDAARREEFAQADAAKGAEGYDTTFQVKDYKINFTPDVIVGNPGYSTYWGFQGVTQMLFSDILGNHQIYFQANLFRDLLNSSFYFAYQYLPEIIDYQASAHHQAIFVYIGNDLYRFRNFGAG
ncbi:MAG: peptidase MA family metallohydrolase, partial [Bacteroidota bacterium]